MKTTYNNCLHVVSLLVIQLLTNQGIAAHSTATVNLSLGNPQLDWRTGARTASTTEYLAIESITNAATGEVERKDHRYIVAGSGLNYLDESGQWQESKDLIELLPDGSAASRQAPTKIYFTPNLNHAAPITIVTPEKLVMKTRLLGLFYYDAGSGRAVLLSKVMDSVAELHPPNQIVYKSALTSGDIRVTCTRDGFETDFILTRKPKPPEAYSLNPATTRLELWHEYMDAPVPRRLGRMLAHESNPSVRQAMSEPDLIDETLNIGHLWFPPGRAFSASNLEYRPPDAPARIRLPDASKPEDKISVSKRWLRIQNKDVLVESVPWSTIEAEVKGLPETAQSDGPSGAEKAYAGRRLPSLGSTPTRKGDRIKVATAKYSPSGFVMDYIVVSGTGDFTFEPSTTYLVDGNLYTDGTVTFQSGCVVKYSDGGMAILYGTIVCNSGSVLTSKNDDSFGETISGSTHMPGFDVGTALSIYYIDHGITLSGFRIRWAQKAIQLDANGCGEITHTVQGTDLEFCQTGIYANNCSVTLDGVTACGVSTPIYSVDGCANFSGSVSNGSGCDSDSDGNGLPDSWEFRYFGTIHIDVFGDPDSDGVSNVTEYRQGRNPTVAGTAPDSNQINLQVYTPLK